MIFALSTDDRTLIVFPTDSDAIAHCEGVDVEDGIWLFFDFNGRPLVAEFVKPNVRGAFGAKSGKYILRPDTAQSGSTLQERFPDIRAVDGKSPYDSVESVRRLLTNG